MIVDCLCVMQRRLANWIVVGAGLSANFVTYAGFLSPPLLIGAYFVTKVNLGG